MKNFIISLVIIVFVSVFFISCDVDSPTSLLFNSPECRITNVSSVEFPESGFPKMTVTVVNRGDGPTAFSIGCYVKLKNGNYILDDGCAGFGTLLDGESRSEEIKFFDLEKSDYITSREITLYWYDAEGIYYYEIYH